jgi:DNA-binding FadR family transcriptional regulator
VFPHVDPSEFKGAKRSVAEVEWQPIARVRTHRQVISEIERRLRSGGLRPGDRLPPERQLAEALGVSRGAVREALRILEAIGVVEAGTGSGPTSGSRIVSDSAGGLAMVLGMHLQTASLSLDDMVEVRLVLERLAAEKVALRADPEGIAELRGLLDQMRSATSSEAYNELDTAFHVQIGNLSGNDLVAVLMSALRTTMRRAMVAAFEQLEDPRATMASLTDEHAAILEALAAGRGDEAARLVTDHIAGFYRLVDLAEPS